MASSAPVLAGPSIRRTRSAGDPPTTEVQTPSLPSSSPSFRRSESNARVQPPNPPTIWAPATTILEAPETATGTQAATAQPSRSRLVRFAAFFGWGRQSSRARKEIVALSWNLTTGFLQVTAIVTLLSIAGTTESPIHPGQNEWRACERPLGVWAILWVLRVFLSASLAYWGFLRERRARLSAESTAPVVNLDGTVSLTAPTPTSPRPATRTTRTPPTNNQPLLIPHSPLFTRLSLLSSLITLSWFLTAHIIEYTSVNTCRYSAPHLWWLVFGILCVMYLMVLEVVLVGLIVFVVLPILFLAWNIILIVLGRHPLQHPQQIKPDIESLPKAVVERIPLVMYIPPPPEGEEEKQKEREGGITMPAGVHLYPPRHPPTSPNSNANAHGNHKRRFRFLRLKKKTDSSSNKGSGDGSGSGGNGERDPPMTWEDNWEQGEYPFVRLEGNRAACAICLLDFEEPKRVGGVVHTATGGGSGDEGKKDEEENVWSKDKVEGEEGKKGEDKNKGKSKGKSGGKEREDDGGDGIEGLGILPFSGDGGSGSGSVTVSAAPATTTGTGSGSGNGTPADLRLEDAGEGAQPLRLLVCGHVFHKTCLDPWLIDVSGRCPVCQRRVELPEEPPKGKGTHHRLRRGTRGGGGEEAV